MSGLHTEGGAEEAPQAGGGAVAWMARNPVAANLAMIVILVGGLLGLTRVKQEVFPEFSLDLITISVPYPGASPAEVEQGIVLAIEEAVRGLDGVKRVRSTANEGVGSVAVELLISADNDAVLADVKAAVDRVSSLPEDSEEPLVALSTRRSRVITLVVAGEVERTVLYELAEEARRRMLASPEVTQVETDGLPPLEVSIEISREKLRAYGLSLQAVAAQVRAASLELPGGEIETDGGELLLRLSDRRRRGHEFEDMILRGTDRRSEIRLGDIATITDGFADDDSATYYNGQQAVRLTAYRVGDETPARVSVAVNEVMDEMREELPSSVSLAIWDDDSKILASRIDLLVRNARVGLILVLVSLALFLDLRLAFWVAMGIPISFMGAFLLMPALDLSVNMITLFAFIVTLGMVVDDAIVVGENAYEYMQKGMSRSEAARKGAQEMIVPVTFAILTTWATFAPLLFVPGVMGKFFRLMPMVVISVLGVSLLESFFVLPSHLAHGTGGEKDEKPKTDPNSFRAQLMGILKRIGGTLVAPIDAVRKRVDGVLQWFIHTMYRPVLSAFMKQRYIAMAAAAALLMFSVGMVRAGILKFTFFPVLEGDVITASARLPYGVAIERTMEVQAALEQAGREAVIESGGLELMTGMITGLGTGATRGGGPNGPSAAGGSHVVTVEIELVPSEEREITASQVSRVWEERMPQLPGVEALSFSANVGPGANSAVDLQLSHPDTDTLREASAAAALELRQIADLSQVDNQFNSGKPQISFQLRPEARSLGLTANDVARQLRSAFFGAEALREQRGRNELRVMVRLPRDQRRSEFDLEEFEVVTPAGGFVPLSYVADFTRDRAPTSIFREDSKRIVNVTAAMAPGVESPREALSVINNEVLPQLRERYDGLEIDLVGDQREQADTFATLGQNFLISMFVVFALLAIPFRSYTQPLIIMSVIPFGIVGAIWGHVVMGYNISIISMFGVVALAGVVVNDSLVLIDAVNKFRAEGHTPWEAVRMAGLRRLRPIFLTSITTFLGLAPMIAETSVQARFLIPMAISLGFGVMFATVIVLLLVPCVYLVLEDIKWLFGAGPGVGEETPATPVEETETPAAPLGEMPLTAAREGA